MIHALFVCNDTPFYTAEFYREWDRIGCNNGIRVIGNAFVGIKGGSERFRKRLYRSWYFYGPRGFFIMILRLAWHRIMNKIAIGIFNGKFPGMFSVRHYLMKSNWKFFSFTDINASEFIEFVQSQNTDVIITIGIGQKLKMELLTTPSLGVFNIHNSALPRNRGLLPAFWTLYELDKFPQGAITVYRMDEGFDTGPILFQESIQLNREESLEQFIIRTKKCGAHAACNALRKLSEGNFKLMPNDHSKSIYRKFPTAEEVKHFREKGLRII